MVQHFGALMEQGRSSEAAKLWGDAEAAADFLKQLKPGAHLEIGDSGHPRERPARSTQMCPWSFMAHGFRRPADVILRRVNDVPGSTEAQRRWHIERIEWSEALERVRAARHRLPALACLGRAALLSCGSEAATS